ncbi:hypothetical protein DAETH_04850 [Deinococcus aetherius]|uniref:Uncharacterized protein n=1 Tax=Deinococcus aetherius TaxID=200252 RepID=A0ABM8AA04_9DEIO|nr:hypothetical protein DAETH_04850 [Deinococcus aetherius]
MSNLKLRGERASLLADPFPAVPGTLYRQRSLEAALGLFLDLGTRTTGAATGAGGSSKVPGGTRRFRKRAATTHACGSASTSPSVPKTARNLPYVRVNDEV